MTWGIATSYGLTRDARTLWAMETTGLTVLGNTVRHSIEHVEVFPAPAHVTTVRFTTDELQSMCPVTQQPDIAHVVIEYTPDRWCIESKSLKLYLWGFRDRAVFAEALTAEIAGLDTTYPNWRGSFEDYMANILHVLKVVGPDHVGMGADWDGGGGVRDFDSVAELPKVTARLRAAGYSEANLAKIWGGNVLRLMAQAEAYSQSLKPATP